GADLLEQPAHHRAAAQDLTAAGAARAAVELARNLAAPGGDSLEGFDQGRRAHRRAGQRAEHLQHVPIDAVEALRLQSIRRERSDNLAAFGQPATEARMNSEPRLRIGAK